MATRLHLASGRATSVVFDEPLVEEARAHAAHQRDARAAEVNHIADIRAEILRTSEGGTHLTFLDFHTHGGAGFISIGTATFGYSGWNQLAGLAGAFASDAQIEFYGCSVAEGPDGELFLARCAWTLLREHGGAAIGWTTTGFALHPMLGGWNDGTPAHLGEAVRAEVSAGGPVNLVGHRFLRRTRITRRIQSVRDDCERLLRANPPPARRRELTTATNLIHRADDLVQLHPSYRDLHQANHLVDLVRDRLVPFPSSGPRPTYR